MFVVVQTFTYVLLQPIAVHKFFLYIRKDEEAEKTFNKHISTSVWSTQHPNAG